MSQIDLDIIQHKKGRACKDQVGQTESK